MSGKKNFQIIEAFASVDLPEEILENSKIGLLVKDINSAKNNLSSATERMERARQAEKDGNPLMNIIKSRGDVVKDAQLDLNKSIGNLTGKTSELLIINTVLAKVLNDQQKILYGQQEQLEKQADELKDQNNKIFDQQKQLARQQEDINKANQGLMEAKGVTQEQAQKLVGCVTKVTEVESRIDAANEALRSDVEEAVTRCIERLDTGFSAYAQRHDAFETQLTGKFSLQADHAQKTLNQLVAENAQHKSGIQEQLASTIAELGQHRAIFERELTTSFANQAGLVKAEMAQFASDAANFQNTMHEKFDGHAQTVRHQQAKQFEEVQARLMALQVAQRGSTRKAYLVSACAAILAVGTFCWEMAQHGWSIF